MNDQIDKYIAEKNNQDTVPFDFELYQAGLMDLPKEMIEVLDKIKSEIMDTGAYEQEVNGKTEFLKGINYCLSVIDMFEQYKVESEKNNMIRLKFDNQSSEWMNDNFEYNIIFIHRIINNFEVMLKEKKYIYFRDLVDSLGLDPLQYKSTLGWDEKHSDFKYCYSYHRIEDNDYIDIFIKPYDLSSDSEKEWLPQYEGKWVTESEDKSNDKKGKRGKKYEYV